MQHKKQDYIVKMHTGTTLNLQIYELWSEEHNIKITIVTFE